MPHQDIFLKGNFCYHGHLSLSILAWSLTGQVILPRFIDCITTHAASLWKKSYITLILFLLVFKHYIDFCCESWAPAYTSSIVLSRTLAWTTLMEWRVVPVPSSLIITGWPLSNYIRLLWNTYGACGLKSLWNCLSNQTEAKWQKMLLSKPLLLGYSDVNIFSVFFFSSLMYS